MEMYWLKVDIDGAGRRWHLVRIMDPHEGFDYDESGPMIEFVGQEFSDFENNYLQNERQDLATPFDPPDGCSSEVLRSIAVNELWLGMVECRSCGYTWPAASPWNVDKYECPRCKIMSASRLLSRGEELAERIITAMVYIGGLSASGSIQNLEGDLNMALGSVLPSSVRDDALRYLRDLMPVCDKCGGHGGDCDVNEHGETVSWVCDKCGGIGRIYEKQTTIKNQGE